MSNPDASPLTDRQKELLGKFRQQCQHPAIGPGTALLLWEMSGDLPREVLIDDLKAQGHEL